MIATGSEISIRALKGTLPCSLLQLVQSVPSVRLRKDGKAWKGYCLFHPDTHPSLSIFWGRDGNWRFHCPGCGADGDIFDWVTRTQRTTTLTDSLNWLTSGRAAEFLAQEEPADNHLGGAVLDVQKIQRIHPKTVITAAHNLRDERVRAAKPRYAQPFKYGAQRGWLPDTLRDAEPYPVGAGFFPGQGDRARALSEHPILAFPQIVKTRRLAELFRLTDEWSRWGEVCVGVKYRLTPEAQGVLTDLAMDRGLSVQEALADQPRWFAKPGFTACIPWEMDRNEGPEVDRLVICEGPGDGVRLYHEAYATDSLRPSFIKSHIVAVDSSASWTDASLAIPDNATGFFSGYSQIVLLMDKDSAGRRAAGVIAGLIRRQGSRAAIRNVDLSPYRDVSDFFDAGNGIVDIVSLINSTTTLRAQ